MAIRMYEILEILYTENKWHNVNDLSRRLTPSMNPNRLKHQLVDLTDRGIIQHLNSLTDNEKKVARKDQIDVIKRINNYKITTRGRQKFEKIKESCSKPDALMGL